jgi:carbamoyl-phosphate synthase large subunit
MGLDDDLGVAFAKAQAAAKPGLPVKRQRVPLREGRRQGAGGRDLARALEKMGFTIYSTSGTAQTLRRPACRSGSSPRSTKAARTAVDMIKNGQIQMVINTPAGMIPRRDENADPVGGLCP